jgi:hypothetical protein
MSVPASQGDRGQAYQYCPLSQGEIRLMVLFKGQEGESTGMQVEPCLLGRLF